MCYHRLETCLQRGKLELYPANGGASVEFTQPGAGSIHIYNFCSFLLDTKIFLE